MYVLVMYDVSEANPRRRIAQRCKDFGLRRAQQSVFMGRADAARRKVLCEVLEHTLGEDHGVVHVLPVNRADLAGLFVIHNPREEVEDGG